MEYEVEGSRPEGRYWSRLGERLWKKTAELVNYRKNAMDRSRWSKLIKDS